MSIIVCVNEADRAREYIRSMTVQLSQMAESLGDFYVANILVAAITPYKVIAGEDADPAEDKEAEI